MNKDTFITFIGAGKMASSIIGGLIAHDYPPNKITACAPSNVHLAALAKQYAIHTSHDNVKTIAYTDILILAVKPQQIEKVSKEISTMVQSKKPLIISIAAGVSIQSLTMWLGDSLSIVRCMPNTPALVQSGATGLYANQHVTAAQKQTTTTLLNATGITAWLNQEKQLDMITALSGSGPAYYFLLMETMMETATALGLPTDVAEAFTIETALGAAKMAKIKRHPAILRKNVTSPGGTTAAALSVFEQAGFKTIVHQAMTAAFERSLQLGKQT